MEAHSLARRWDVAGVAGFFGVTRGKSFSLDQTGEEGIAKWAKVKV